MRISPANPIKIGNHIIDLNDVSHMSFLDLSDSRDKTCRIYLIFKSGNLLTIPFKDESQYLTVQNNLQRYIQPLDITQKFNSLPPDNYPKNK